MTNREHKLLSACRNGISFSELCYFLDSSEQSAVWEEMDSLRKNGMVVHFRCKVSYGRFALSSKGRKEIGLYENTLV